MSVDYYSILGLDRSAPHELVDKAYRILARKLHPDSGHQSDPAAFGRIQTAYEALSDPRRRATYDAGMIEAQQSGRAGGRDVYQLLPLRFEQAASGGRISISRISPAGPRSLDIDIPAAVENGERLRIPGYGQPGGGGAPPGDLVLIVGIEPHRTFRREGLDLYVEVPVPVDIAMLGGKIKAPTLNGAVDVDVPAGTSGGTTLRVRAKGLHNPNGQHGDLFVVPRIKIPRSVAEEARLISESGGAAPSVNARVVLFDPLGNRRDFALGGAATLVGRKSPSDLVVPDTSVSRRHCQFEIRGDELWVRDVGSRNGTFVNRERAEQRKLEPGDVVTVGHAHFVVVIGDEPADVKATASNLKEGIEAVEYIPVGGHMPAAGDPQQQADYTARLAELDEHERELASLRQEIDHDRERLNADRRAIEEERETVAAAAAAAPVQAAEPAEAVVDEATERELAEAREQVESLRGELDELRGQLEEASAAADAQRARADEAAGQAETRAGETVSLTAQVEALRSELSGKSSTAASAAAVAAEAAALATQREQVEAARSEVQSLREQVTADRSAAAEAHREAEAAADAAAGAVEAERRSLAEARERFESQQAELTQRVEADRAALDQQREAFLATREKAGAAANDLDAQRQALEETVRQLEDDRAAMRKQHAQVDADRHAVEADRAAVQEQAAAVEADRSQVEGDRADLEEQRRELVERRQRLEADREQVETDRAAVASAQQQIESELAALGESRGAIETERGELEAARAGLAAAQGALATAQSELESTRGELDDRRAELDRRGDELSAPAEELTNARTALDADRAALDADRHAVEADRESVNADRAALATDRESLDKDRAAIEEAEAALQSSAADLERRTAELDARDAAAADRARQLTEQAESLDERADALSRREAEAEALREQLDQRRGELDARVAQVEQAEHRFAQLETAEADLARRVGELEGRIAEVNDRATALDDRTAELDSRAGELAGLAAELESARAALDTGAAELHTQREALADQRNEAEALTARLAQQRERLESETASHAQRVAALEAREREMEATARRLIESEREAEGRIGELEHRAMQLVSQLQGLGRHAGGAGATAAPVAPPRAAPPQAPPAPEVSEVPSDSDADDEHVVVPVGDAIENAVTDIDIDDTPSEGEPDTHAGAPGGVTVRTSVPRFRFEPPAQRDVIDLSPNHLRAASGYRDRKGHWHLFVDFIDKERGAAHTWNAEVRYYRSENGSVWKWVQTPAPRGQWRGDLASSDPDSFSTASPAAVVADGTLLLFYAGRSGVAPDAKPGILAAPGEPGYLRSTIMLATCRLDDRGSPAEPFVKRGPVVEPGDGWDRMRVDQPSAVVIDGLVHLFYTGYDDARDLTRRKLGYATAKLDDLRFTRRERPVLEVPGGGETPRAFRYGNLVHLFYQHFDHMDASRWRHYVAPTLPAFELVDANLFDGPNRRPGELMVWTDATGRLLTPHKALATAMENDVSKLIPYDLPAAGE